MIIVFIRSSNKFPIHGDKQIIRGATSMKSEILFQHMQFQARFQDHQKSSEFNGFYLSTGYTKYYELEKKLSPEYTSWSLHLAKYAQADTKGGRSLRSPGCCLWLLLLWLLREWPKFQQRITCFHHIFWQPSLSLP